MQTDDKAQKIQWLGKLDVDLLQAEFGIIQTEELIVTGERLTHIRMQHPDDMELFEKYGADVVRTPDFIIKDIRHTGTIFIIKRFPDTNLNLVVRVALKSDSNELKNSVMTFYRIRDSNLKKLIKKNKLIYHKE